MNNKMVIKILDKCIKDIINKNYSSEYINFGFSYSKSVTNILNVLGAAEYRNIYTDAIKNYDNNRIKKLDQQENEKSFDLVDCIIYFNWLWHVEGTGLASGIINTRIENGKYLKVLMRFKALVEEK